MNWIVLILSLGAMIMSVIHGVMALLLSSGGAAQAGSPFTMTTGALLLAAAAFAVVGGGMAFTRRRSGGVLLIVSSIICLFAHADTRIYAGLYIVAGILAFFCRRKDAYEYYEDDEDEEDDDDEPEWQKRARPEDDSDDYENISNMRRTRNRERVKTLESRIRPNREEYSETRVRGRSVKTCPHCMTEVDISHKFCNECGHPLSISERIPSERISSDAIEPDNTPSAPLEDTPFSPILPIKEKSPFALSPEDKSDSESSKYDAGESEEDDDTEVSPSDSRDDNRAFSEDDDELQEAKSSPRHKVFVKPDSDGQPIPKMPINIGPDNSYQAFHNYTRRRRHKRYSLLRRLLAIFILLSAVSGTAWFLLGLSKTPQKPDAIPAEQPTVVLTPEIDDPVLSADRDGMAVPSDSAQGDIFSSLRIDSPTRGVVIGNGVNVRSDHSTSSSKVTTINQGARTDVLNSWQGVSGAQSGAWYQIRTPSSGNGWIYGQYFQPLDSRATTLPSGYTSALLKTFGSNKTELAARLGATSRQTPTTLTWQGVSVNIRGDSDITRIQLTSALHVLQNGVAVGITEDRLYQSVGYPSEYRAGQLLYLESPTQGMSIQMKNGKVERVTVGNI